MRDSTRMSAPVMVRVCVDLGSVFVFVAMICAVSARGMRLWVEEASGRRVRQDAGAGREADANGKARFASFLSPGAVHSSRRAAGRRAKGLSRSGFGAFRPSLDRSSWPSPHSHGGPPPRWLSAADGEDEVQFVRGLEPLQQAQIADPRADSDGDARLEPFLGRDAQAEPGMVLIDDVDHLADGPSVDLEHLLSAGERSKSRGDVNMRHARTRESGGRTANAGPRGQCGTRERNREAGPRPMLG